MEKCKKEKTPAPGQYKLQKSLKELDKEKKQNSQKKHHYQDRMTYLDCVQYEASQTPGIGAYNVRNRVIIILF